MASRPLVVIKPTEGTVPPPNARRWLRDMARREFNGKAADRSAADDHIQRALDLWALRQALRAELLACASRLISIHWPVLVGEFKAETNLERGPYCWAFNLAGVLSVHERNTGRCVVRSLPGQPAVMDAASPDGGLRTFLVRYGEEWAADMPNGDSLTSGSSANHCTP